MAEIKGGLRVGKAGIGTVQYGMVQYGTGNVTFEFGYGTMRARYGRFPFRTLGWGTLTLLELQPRLWGQMPWNLCRVAFALL